MAHLLLHTQEGRLPRLRILLHENKHHPRLVPQVREISEGERKTASLTTVMPSSPTVLALRRDRDGDGDGDRDNGPIGVPQWGAMESIVGAISSEV